ncbi:uncharacterized protein LOC120268948 isoform X3 [Dioscorea cayenensis subsp. rotundata]|uniref:Uncharacterized protein LOC120268948 isoform X3 n=1 Tax=Dioscorea cayennensis subsp. rotundata TaxID=55577 RepID=A0AB40BXE9_DIOCR|nr:uncharacterized protein LOC120268948 isoform X3 [Dioscorea cayenensis subsp. rotundata]
MEGENGGAERGDDSSAAAGDGEGGRSASSDAEEGNWSSTSLLYSQSCEAIELEVVLFIGCTRIASGKPSKSSICFTVPKFI